MQIVTQDDDSPDFVSEVRVCAAGIVRCYHPAEFFLIKTNNWFGANWLGFSGKSLGLVGAWNKKLTVPPFVPHRILWERRYLAPHYKQVPIRDSVHVRTSGEGAQKRYVSEVAPNASLLWYSGASRSSGRAAMMAYLLVGHSYWAWYAGWAFRETWKIVKTCGATPVEIAEIRKPSEHPPVS
jgi:hypothetical protein